MSTLERAIEIAAAAHAGQVDKAGAPYILHPLRVMMSVRAPHERMAAVLHDVVEDTSITLADLEAEGFPREVIDAIGALTKSKGESRIDAARRAAAHPIARVVKLADVADNMDLTRIPNPTESDHARLRQYAEVKALLETAASDYEVSFSCAECGAVAGVVRLRTSELGVCLEVSSFTSELKVPARELSRSIEQLQCAMRSAQSLYELDFELAPYYCPTCELTFCGAHWRTRDVFDEDGFHDSIRGVCARGHERMLED